MLGTRYYNQRRGISKKMPFQQFGIQPNCDWLNLEMMQGSLARHRSLYDSKKRIKRNRFRKDDLVW